MRREQMSIGELTVDKILNGLSGLPNSYTFDGEKQIAVYTTSASADGSTSYEPQLFNNVLTGAGQVGGRFRINMSTDVTLGAWANAFKASVDLNEAGGVTGLMSVICAEFTMATTSISGTYAALELEMSYGATNGSLAKPCFIYANTNGTAKTNFDTYGDFMKIGPGITAGSGKMLSAASQTLRVGTGALQATHKYLVLSAAEDCMSLAGTPTAAIIIGGTPTTGIDFTSQTMVLDSGRTYSCIAIGDRLGAKTITMAGAVNHLDLIQMNLLIDGVNPTAGSTINGMYQLISGDPSTDMASIRLKCTDFNVVVKQNVQDVYCYQGEVDFTTNALTVGGEAAVLGLVMNCASAVTGNIRGIILSVQGTGLPDGTSSIGFEMRTTGTTLGEGIRLMGTPQMTVGLVMGNPAGAAGEGNEAPVSAFYWPAGPSADQGPVRNSAKSGDGDGSIQIKVGSGTKYLQFWDAAS